MTSRSASWGPPSRGPSFPEFPVPDQGARSYVKTLDSAGLKGTRVGVVRSFFGLDPEADRHTEDALRAMRELGAEIIDDLYMESYGEFQDGIGEGNIVAAEFAYNLNDYLTTYTPDGPILSIDDLLAFYWDHQVETEFWGEGDGLLIAQTISPDAIYEDWYIEQLELNHTLTREQGIDLLMDDNNLDVLVAPSCPLPTEAWANDFAGSSTQAAAMAGYPSLTLPVGYTNGLPAGMHLFGRAFSERKLLRYAYALEQSLNLRRPPEYLDEIRWD